MLTYRTGAVGAPSAAKAMGGHLLQQTLSPEMAAMAEYHAQGMAPPTPAETARACCLTWLPPRPFVGIGARSDRTFSAYSFTVYVGHRSGL